MRTTLTLDDDVAAVLERLRRNREENLKVLVNEALRRGFKQVNKWPEQRHPFLTRAVALGHCASEASITSELLRRIFRHKCSVKPRRTANSQLGESAYEPFCNQS